MTTVKDKPIDERFIPGLTIKQLWRVGGTIAVSVGLIYLLLSRISDAERVSKDNNSILKEIQADRKESERLNNIRLTNIELDQREAKIRLTQLESRTSH